MSFNVNPNTQEQHRMSQILREKFTANAQGPFIVFIVGGHVNNLLLAHKWLPVAWNFLKLTRYVTSHPETGCLAGHFYERILPFGFMFQSYWRSFEELETWSRSKEEGHLGAWTDYVRKLGLDGTLGIWHELYKIEPKSFETVYANSVPYGLSKAFGANPIVGRAHNARGRINPHDETVSTEPLIPLS
jgi:hypothetical protein